MSTACLHVSASAGLRLDPVSNCLYPTYGSRIPCSTGAHHFGEVVASLLAPRILYNTLPTFWKHKWTDTPIGF